MVSKNSTKDGTAFDRFADFVHEDVEFYIVFGMTLATALLVWLLGLIA